MGLNLELNWTELGQFKRGTAGYQPSQCHTEQSDLSGSKYAPDEKDPELGPNVWN